MTTAVLYYKTPDGRVVPIVSGATGPAGPAGPAGADGAPGATGPAGPPGSGGSKSLDDLTTFNDIYGTSPTGWDYEFDGLGTSLPAGWTIYNQDTGYGNITYSEQAGRGIASLRYTPGESLQPIVQSLSGAPTKWVAVGKCGFSPTDNRWARSGICIRQNGGPPYGGPLVQIGLANNNNRGNIHLNKWSDWRTFSANIREVDFSYPIGGTYFKIQKNSDTSYDFYVSSDGAGWQDWSLGYDPGFVPDQVGWLVGGQDNYTDATIDWFRLRSVA